MLANDGVMICNGNKKAILVVAVMAATQSTLIGVSSNHWMQSFTTIANAASDPNVNVKVRKVVTAVLEHEGQMKRTPRRRQGR
eukprot:8605071-Ditylum_brightwellii.AAC.1